MSATTRVFLVDDHSLFRESLRRWLCCEAGIEVAGDCGTMDEAMGQIKGCPIDLLLLDYDLGDKNANCFIAKAKHDGFAGKILIITAGMSDTESLMALKLGAVGIFLKHNPPAMLRDAIHKVMAGGTWLDERSMRLLVRSAGCDAEGERGAFAKREEQVLNGLMQGRTNKEIGVALSMSEGAVKAALQQLFAKTGARTRSQLVRVALERHAQQRG